jgi:hypothetical protein
MPKTRYAIGREYVRLRATSDVDISGITPQAALVPGAGVQPDPADWEDVATITDGPAQVLMVLVGNPPHETATTFPIEQNTIYQVWARYTVGDEVVVRPVETVEAK